MKKVCIVMGSDSDLKVMSKCADKLKDFGIPFDVRVISAHRTPAAAEQLAKNAAADGFGVIIAAAGKAGYGRGRSVERAVRVELAAAAAHRTGVAHGAPPIPNPRARPSIQAFCPRMDG